MVSVQKKLWLQCVSIQKFFRLSMYLVVCFGVGRLIMVIGVLVLVVMLIVGLFSVMFVCSSCDSVQCGLGWLLVVVCVMFRLFVLGVICQIIGWLVFQLCCFRQFVILLIVLIGLLCRLIWFVLLKLIVYLWMLFGRNCGILIVLVYELSMVVGLSWLLWVQIRKFLRFLWKVVWWLL